jgi:DNA-directed RNA polymerase I, II, and III subunit RPABC2
MDEDFDNDNESVVSETDSEPEQEKQINAIPIDMKNKKVVFNEDDDDYVESENGDGEDDDDDLDLESENSDIGEEADVIVDTNRPFNEFDNFSNDSDDESETDDNYLQKFDVASRQKIISEFHPELQAHNSDEVEILSRVVRDENGKIIDPLHKTLPFITKYEKARIIGERAKQLDAGAEPLVDVEPSMIDGYLIALKEYEEKAIPFIIQRPLPSGGCEYWKFSDLEIL